MKFKSPLATAISGSVAGLTFSKNAAGSFIRSRRRASVSNSNATTRQRAIVGSLHGLWRSLSVTQRSGWATAAGLLDSDANSGGHRYLNGRSAFIAYNSLAALTSGALPLRRDPPVAPHMLSAWDPLEAFFDVFGDGECELECSFILPWRHEADTAQVFLLLWNSRPFTASHARVPPYWSLAACIECVANLTDVQFIEQLLVGKFSLSGGQGVAVKCVCIDDLGRFSHPFFFRATTP